MSTPYGYETQNVVILLVAVVVLAIFVAFRNRLGRRPRT
jgi:hypothetical protein